MYALYQAKNADLNNNWNDFMNQAQQVNWSPEDRMHVIDQLNGEMDMQMLRNVLKAKMKDMFDLVDHFPGFNEDMKFKIAKCIIYTSMAIKVNEQFECSESFSCQLILARFDSMSFDQ